MKRIKIISMILAFVMLVTSCNLGMMFTSNAATSIEVSTAVDLAALATKVNEATGDVNITIKQNIDASGIKYTPIDASGKKVTFDGQYRLISNLNINGGGLFSSVGDGSSFKFVTMYNCTITDFDAGAGYGFLAGIMNSGTVNKCFVDGTISVYGDSASYIGGLVGSFGGKMEKSVAMVDIYTDGSYVGGLIGSYSESETMSDNHVSYCYSTGSIDNDSRDYIGGLVGRSATPAFNNSYTSMCILNPYADTVKAIGVILGLKEEHNVYYDKNVSLQRQGDMDPHRSTPSELSTKLTGTEWTNIDGYYPQLDDFANNSSQREFLKRLSALSAAVVDVSREDGITTGREFTVVSSANNYSYALLTVYDGSSTAVLPEVNSIDWRITGGVDEYYFDPADLSDFPTNSGATLDGLSGNTYDVKTGKYLFTNTGDIRFTAYSGDYERDIYVHVTTADKNPYIQGGTGTADDPFIINDYTEFDMIRVYCLDDEIGKYNYKFGFTEAINTKYDAVTAVKVFDLSLSGVEHSPIIGMKGTLDGNGTIVSGVDLKSDNEGNIGIFATTSQYCVIKDIHISNAVLNCNRVDADGNSLVINAGLLAGSMGNTTVLNTVVTGTIYNAQNSGIIAGSASGSTTFDTCITYGVVSGNETSAGIAAVTGETVKAIRTFSSAVVADAQTVGGFFAVGGGDVEDSVFAGNLSAVKNGVRHGLVDTGTVTNAYYDWQAAGILYSGDSYAVDTATLITPNGVNLSEAWEWYTAGLASVYQTYVHYPQLKELGAPVSVENNYNGYIYYTTSTTYTSRTSNAAALSVTYNNQSGPASSVSFSTANINLWYETEMLGLLSKPNPYNPEKADGYSDAVSGQYSNNCVITLGTGGRQIYSFNAAGLLGTAAMRHCDTRYVMFNVKNINVHYKYSYTDDAVHTDYNKDMVNKGLVSVTNGFTNTYNLFLNPDTTESFETIKFLYVGETMNFKKTLPTKYTYTVTAYSDKQRTQVLDVVMSDTGALVDIADLDDVYIVFTIQPKTLPWGIYRLTSN